MKKLLLLVLAVALVVSCALLAACDPCANGHDWGEWETTTDPTCTEKGVQTRKCLVCDETETQSIDELGHNAVHVDGTPATCEDPGYEEGTKCSRCDEVLSGLELIQSLQHQTKIVFAKAATCTEPGHSRGHQCTVCGKIIDGVEPIAALGHNEIEIPATVATCTQPAYTAGSKCDRCGEVFVTPQVAEGSVALGHDFEESSLNYITYTACSRECGAYKILGSKKIYESDFVFDFDEAKQSEIDEVYEEIEAVLSGTGDHLTGPEFDELFEIYDAYIGYIQFQYQVGQILNDISYNASTRSDFATISAYYYESIERYYGLFREIYESNEYSEYFFKDWTQEEILEILDIADSYDASSRTAADEITDTYEDWFANVGGLANATQSQKLELFDLYSQLVVANNNIAKTAGFDNYMEYAYANVYERDYSPEDAAPMREFVREYIGPIVEQVANEYEAWNNAYQNRGGWTSRENQLYYSQYVGTWMWRNPDDYVGDAERTGMILESRQSLNDYFTFLSANVNENHPSFHTALSDLFENGNYFLGTNPNRTAYTWYIYQLDLPILLFTEDYKDAFTFVHEFGHYYQNVYNKRLGVPMDHDETQSQGNEMLFLAWLREHLPEGMEEGFEILELEQLINMLGSVVLSTAVDEFEYLAYTGATEFNGSPIATAELTDGTLVIDYEKLYVDILTTYWEDIGDWFNTTYWSYVVFDQAGYYISYAMSALPSLEIYAKAGVDGLEETRDSYIKLFSFSDEDEFVQTDVYEYSDGTTYIDRYLKEGVTYQSILNWAGLDGPFQEELYLTIQEFFANR